MYKGKIIYNAGPAAAEYSKWCANFYNWCGGNCVYCFMEDPPFCYARKKTYEDSLKKCLVNEEKAFRIFIKEANKNVDDLRKYGILFNFGSDPFLKETFELNKLCILYATLHKIPVKTLTKQTWWIDDIELNHVQEYMRFGFTLTGHDELEPGCATNAERIAAMETLHERGFKTWASIEPIIDIDKAWDVIKKSLQFCDHYKIGLLSKKSRKKFLSEGIYDKFKLNEFVHRAIDLNYPIYLKDDLIKEIRINREDLPSNCVDRDYL